MKSKKQVVIEGKATVDRHSQATLDAWLIKRFSDKLVKCSLLSQSKNCPIVVYQHVLEEQNDAAEEEIATISGTFVIVQIFAYGGLIPPTFKSQQVFTLDDFALWILRRSENLLLECIDKLEDIM